ncbi:MAG: zinc ribbon domain-containing protein, partial [Chloroflexi bacterium]|nr:zinc ribbon domain-containing protein [Chloroflexota bacterium]
MVCPACQTDNRPGAKFCQECALRLEHRCANCGTAAVPGARFCPDCGIRLERKCPHCATLTLPGARFCQECGYHLDQRCPYCNVHNPPEAKFCHHCGGRMELVCPYCSAAILQGANFCNTCGGAVATGPRLGLVEPIPAVAAQPAPFVPHPAAPTPFAPPSAAPAPAAFTPPPPVAAPPLPVAPAAMAPVPAPLAPPPPIVEAAEQRLPSGELLPPLPPRPAAMPWGAAANGATSDEELEAETPRAANGAGQVEDERRLVSVLFGDVSGFTAMSEKLDPEDTKAIMDSCLRGLADQVEKYDGEVDKFEGDLIMAVWGARRTHEDDAERSVLAAWGMQEFLTKFSRDLERRRGFTLRMRIGINTGEVITGSVGSRREKDFTVYGDVVNTASRFESNANVGHIMVGLKTFNLTKHMVDFTVLEPIRVKGKAEPLPVFEVETIRQDRGRRRGVAGLDSPMVGREHQLGAVVAAYFKMLDSKQVSRLTILGVPGLGKSRLLGEFQQVTEAEPG